MIYGKLIGIGVALALCISAILYVIHLQDENEKLTAEKTTLKIQLSTSESSVKVLQNNIDTQNKAIDDLKKQSDIREKSHEADLAKAKASAIQYKKFADDIMKSTRPQNVSTCDAANLLINKEIAAHVN